MDTQAGGGWLRTKWWLDKKSKIDFWETLRLFQKNLSEFFFFSQKSNTEKPSGIQERFFQLPTHNSGLKYQTRLGPVPIV
jgi:hypothetical protein